MATTPHHVSMMQVNIQLPICKNQSLYVKPIFYNYLMPQKRGKYVGVRLDTQLYKHLPRQGKSETIRDILAQYYSKELLSKDDIKTLEQENQSLNKQIEELNKRMTELNNQIEEYRKDKFFLMKQVEDQKILYLPWYKRILFRRKKEE